VCYLANKAASAFFCVCVFAGSFGLFRKNDSVGSIIHAMVIDGEGKKKLEEKDNKSSIVIFVFSLLLLLLLLLKPKFNWDWLGMIWGGVFFLAVVGRKGYSKTILLCPHTIFEGRKWRLGAGKNSRGGCRGIYVLGGD